MNYKIPLSKPHLSGDELNVAKNCISSTWISSKSPWIEKFEKSYAKHVSKTRYAASVNSGTSALFLALKALNIGPGDEVILPTFTMIATVNAVVWTGATPVLVDCASQQDWNMDVREVERKITSKTKVIMPVHIYGYVCDMKPLQALAKKYKLHIVEDAAEAMGSEYHGERAGSFGTLSCFSLYANKIITTGNGGMVCTDSKDLYLLIKKLAFFDFNEKTHFKHLLFGYNLVLSGIQGALGCAQVRKFDTLVGKRRKIYAWYDEYTKSKDVRLMPVPAKQNPNFWFPAFIFESAKKKVETQKKLEKKGVETRDFFIPVHRQPIYRQTLSKVAFPNADYFAAHGLLLPSYHGLTKKEVHYISDILIA